MKLGWRLLAAGLSLKEDIKGIGANQQLSSNTDMGQRVLPNQFVELVDADDPLVLPQKLARTEPGVFPLLSLSRHVSSLHVLTYGVELSNIS